MYLELINSYSNWSAECFWYRLGVWLRGAALSPMYQALDSISGTPKSFHEKRQHLGQWVNCLGPQDLCKKPSMAVCVWNPWLGTREKEWSWGIACQVVLLKLESSGFSERSCLKRRYEECWRETPDCQALFPMTVTKIAGRSSQVKPSTRSAKQRKRRRREGRLHLTECQHLETCFQN